LFRELVILYSVYQDKPLSDPRSYKGPPPRKVLSICHVSALSRNFTQKAPCVKQNRQILWD